MGDRLLSWYLALKAQEKKLEIPFPKLLDELAHYNPFEKKMREFRIDLYGKLSEIKDREDAMKKEFYEMCMTSRAYTYFSNDGKISISSALPVDDYSIYLEQIKNMK